MHRIKILCESLFCRALLLCHIADTHMRFSFKSLSQFDFAVFWCLWKLNTSFCADFASLPLTVQHRYDSKMCSCAGTSWSTYLTFVTHNSFTQHATSGNVISAQEVWSLKQCHDAQHHEWLAATEDDGKELDGRKLAHSHLNIELLQCDNTHTKRLKALACTREASTGKVLILLHYPSAD